MKNKNLLSCFTVETMLEINRLVFQHEKEPAKEKASQSPDWKEMNDAARNILRKYAGQVETVLGSGKFLNLNAEAQAVGKQIKQALTESTIAESALNKSKSDKVAEAKYLATMLKGGYTIIEKASASGAEVVTPEGKNDIEKIEISPQEVKSLLWSKLTDDQKTVLNDLIEGYQGAEKPGKADAYKKYDDKFKEYAKKYGIPCEHSDRPAENLFSPESFLDALNAEEVNKLSKMAAEYKDNTDETTLKNYRDLFMALCVKYGFVAKPELLKKLDIAKINDAAEKEKTKKLLQKARGKVDTAIDHFLGSNYPESNRNPANLQIEISNYLGGWWKGGLDGEEKKLLASKELDYGDVAIPGKGPFHVKIRFTENVVLIDIINPREKEEKEKAALTGRGEKKLKDGITHFENNVGKKDEATANRVLHDFMDDWWNNELDPQERKMLNDVKTTDMYIRIGEDLKKVYVVFHDVPEIPNERPFINISNK